VETKATINLHFLVERESQQEEGPEINLESSFFSDVEDALLVATPEHTISRYQDRNLGSDTMAERLRIRKEKTQEKNKTQ
jgi:hypothetical protein